MILDIIVALVAIAAVEAWAFVVLYHFRTQGHWRDSRLGRHLMSFVAVVAALLTLALVSRAWGPLAWLVWVALGLYIALDYVIGRRVYLMLRATRGDRDGS